MRCEIYYPVQKGGHSAKVISCRTGAARAVIMGESKRTEDMNRSRFVGRHSFHLDRREPDRWVWRLPRCRNIGHRDRCSRTRLRTTAPIVGVHVEANIGRDVSAKVNW